MPFYRFSAASTLPDDGYSVIAPYVGTGRWVLLRDNVGVQSIAQLQAIPAQERSPNIAVFVAAANAWYTFKSAAATLPTDIMPTAGTGSWALNTAIVEVIPPYQKVFDIREVIERADRIDFVLIQSINYPIQEAVARADRIGYGLVSAIDYPIREAVARADRVGFALTVIDYPIRESVARAENIGFSISDGSTWLEAATADWLEATAADWLDLPT